jgi:hypothetical protein
MLVSAIVLLVLQLFVTLIESEETSGWRCTWCCPGHSHLGGGRGEQHGNSVSAVEVMVALMYFHRDNREARLERNVVGPTCTCCDRLAE